MKKWISVLLAALMLLPLIAACQLTDEGANTDDPTGTDATDLDLEAVVAKVGEEEITLGEVKELFDNYVEYFSYYGYDVTSDEATLHSFQDDIVNQLVEEKLVSVKAKELGYDQLSDLEQAELDSRVQEELDAMEEYYRAQAEDEYASDSAIDVEARIDALILEEAAYNMSKDGATYEEYAEFLKTDILTAYIAELLKAGELADVDVSEEDVQAKYDELLTADASAYMEDPAAYQVAQNTYEALGEGVPALYIPEGYHRIYDIFIAFDGTLPEDYTNNETTMKTLKSEYQELAFADALAGTTENAARMAEILTDYSALKAANDALYDEYASAAKDKIDGIYAQLQSGADFREVMLENTQNEDFTSSDLFAERGMLITTQYAPEDDWSAATKEAFKALSVGEYSEPYAESSGYHIIFYVGDETAGNRALEGEVYDVIKAQVLSDSLEAEWTDLIEAWKNDGTVEIFTDVYRALGAAVG